MKPLHAQAAKRASSIWPQTRQMSPRAVYAVRHDPLSDTTLLDQPREGPLLPGLPRPGPVRRLDPDQGLGRHRLEPRPDAQHRCRLLRGRHRAGRRDRPAPIGTRVYPHFCTSPLLTPEDADFIDRRALIPSICSNIRPAPICCIMRPAAPSPARLPDHTRSPASAPST